MTTNDGHGFRNEAVMRIGCIPYQVYAVILVSNLEFCRKAVSALGMLGLWRGSIRQDDHVWQKLYIGKPNQGPVEVSWDRAVESVVCNHTYELGTPYGHFLLRGFI
jgi:hypothetical protein